MTDKLFLIENILKKLEKQHRLQGFVSAKQIDEVVENADQRITIVKALGGLGIPIHETKRSKACTMNAMPPEFRQGERKNIRQEIPDRTGHYSDPTWVYLSGLGRVQLMTRGEEVQHAILMRFAQYQMLSKAYRKKEVLDSLFTIAHKLSENKLKCLDVLQTDEGFVFGEESEVKAVGTFLAAIEEIRKKTKTLTEEKKTGAVPGENETSADLWKAAKRNTLNTVSNSV